MKRNNIFMWAYIVAIILCIFRRMNEDFSAWSPIVLAVTVSSMIFAVEDLGKSLYQILDDNLQYMESYISEIKDNLEEEGIILSRVAKKLAGVSESKERKKRIESTEESVNKAMRFTYEKISQYEKSKILYQRIIETCQWNIDVLTFLGFLSIFLILFFSEDIKLSIEDQEQLSVLSFVVILITQQINQFTTDNIKKHINNLEGLRNENMNAIDEATELEKMVDCFVEKRESLDMEATVNAD